MRACIYAYSILQTERKILYSMICLICVFLFFLSPPCRSNKYTYTHTQCVRSDSLESMGDMTSLGNLPYIPAASDVADMMAQGPPQQQQQQQSQQMLNHQTVTNNNNNGGNLMGLTMDAMHSQQQQQPQQQSPPTHTHQQQTINIKPDYGLTAL